VSLPILTAYAFRLYLFSSLYFRRRTETPFFGAPLADPLVSVILPLYNEERVVDRLMGCCTSFTSVDYEVIVVDDSTDSTPSKLERWRGYPQVKVLHRAQREGWKAGALNEGLRELDPRSKYCLVLDADSVPEPDLLARYLVRMEETDADVIQGPQQTDLNSGESWVARGTSLMLNGFNFVELRAKRALGLVIPITGSNFMAKTSVLQAYGFAQDIAEDWNLTIRLWCDGKRVIYDPSLAVRGESPPTLRGAATQFSRWAQGTTRNTVLLAGRVVRSRELSGRLKFDFLMSGFSYVTSLLIILIVLGDIFMPVPAFSTPPTAFLYWGTVIGLLGLPAAPLSLIIATKSSKVKDKVGAILGALVETYIVAPAIAYAVLKGALIRSGSFTRTAKSGWTETSPEAYVTA